jgi:hypothetical protein
MWFRVSESAGFHTINFVKGKDKKKPIFLFPAIHYLLGDSGLVHEQSILIQVSFLLQQNQD